MFGFDTQSVRLRVEGKRQLVSWSSQADLLISDDTKTIWQLTFVLLVWSTAEISDAHFDYTEIILHRDLHVYEPTRTKAPPPLKTPFALFPSPRADIPQLRRTLHVTRGSNIYSTEANSASNFHRILSPLFFDIFSFLI